MRPIDLHVHSCYSDGTVRPEELVAMALKLGLRAFALTDHDTTVGIAYARNELERLGVSPDTLTLIPGIEVTAGYGGRDIHILGLFVDEHCAALQQMLSSSLQSRIKRNEQMLERFVKGGYAITMNDLVGSNDASTITRAHFAKALVAKGYAHSMKDAFDRFLDTTSPYYVPRTYLDPKEVIATLHAAGAFVSLAHPMLYHFSEARIEAMVSELKGYGLDGIEAVYSTYSPEEEAYVKELAKRYDLLLTGGSDYHGDNKPGLAMATGYDGSLFVPETLLDEIARKLEATLD